MHDYKVLRTLQVAEKQFPSSQHFSAISTAVVLSTSPKTSSRTQRTKESNRRSKTLISSTHADSHPTFWPKSPVPDSSQKRSISKVASSSAIGTIATSAKCTYRNVKHSKQKKVPGKSKAMHIATARMLFITKFAITVMKSATWEKRTTFDNGPITTLQEADLAKHLTYSTNTTIIAQETKEFHQENPILNCIS